MRPLLIRGMRGMGDGIYQRPFVRAEAQRREVFIETPWPQLYADLENVRPVRAATTLRTQAKNARAQPESIWHQAPRHADQMTFRYGTAELRRHSIIQTMERQLPLYGGPFVFDLPPAWYFNTPEQGSYVVVRPVTVRREWQNTARNPDPNSVYRAAQWAREAGYRVILVADLADGHEHAVGTLPPHDVAYLKGEMDLTDLMALVQNAAACIGGVGWLVPMAIAARTPLFVLQGGQLAHNGPKTITDSRMDLSRVGWAKPRYPCECDRMNHNCRKDPANLRGDFDEWKTRTGL